jgi:hypothetical protein
MSNRPGIFTAQKHPILSLGVRAASALPPREQNPFEVLVRHLLHRFFHNELFASDANSEDETKRVMMTSYTVALPGLFVALLLIPAYHAFPPAPLHRPFWAQTGDHYFYVMYSFVIMGAATVYEWDLLFPDLLDVFVLSPLPIASRRLFLARVLALAIFLTLVLVGTGILGTIFLPLIADEPSIGRQLIGHAAAIVTSGTFAASTFLALQGILLNILGERFFRRIAPLLQGTSIMLLLAILFLDPILTRSLDPLFTSNSFFVRAFPPFWYLGIYERILAGPAALPIFSKLAQTGILALLFTLAATILTYPLAYRRRVRQIIEGSGTTAAPSPASTRFDHLLHATILPLPAQRAVFHFVNQTILRSQRHRVMLAMYSGLGVALTIANMVVLQVTSGRVSPALLPSGVRAAVPIIAFWTTAGLNAILNAPVDRRGAWLFRVLLGRPRTGHLEATRRWITCWTIAASTATALILHAISPTALPTLLSLAAQLLIAIGVSFLLADLFLFPVRTLPFTSIHSSTITDFPFRIVRYFILFPLFIKLVLHYQPFIEKNLLYLFVTVLVFLAAHRLLLRAHAYSLQQTTVDTPPEEADDFPQSLGLT